MQVGPDHNFLVVPAVGESLSHREWWSCSTLWASLSLVELGWSLPRVRNPSCTPGPEVAAPPTEYSSLLSLPVAHDNLRGSVRYLLTLVFIVAPSPVYSARFAIPSCLVYAAPFVSASCALPPRCTCVVPHVHPVVFVLPLGPLPNAEFSAPNGSPERCVRCHVLYLSHARRGVHLERCAQCFTLLLHTTVASHYE